ncbi:hypothetical protein VFPPC_15789 [Pochonia chlamydosporia 170]|uniref:Uncharacterized protein n=1 Tax=Pochonia chlamydosporia 170 TaxID=1380566 RepID=A0A179FSG1_METCM|nr:hypothetical protein VFPPC_15789 [Pochonia chlamydosporia 170]OAQ68140.1 hypothetical protein VFPPC_15789 [Pochonia chlamydosporia 170]
MASDHPTPKTERRNRKERRNIKTSITSNSNSNSNSNLGRSSQYRQNFLGSLDSDLHVANYHPRRPHNCAKSKSQSPVSSCCCQLRTRRHQLPIYPLIPSGVLQNTQRPAG